MMIKGKGIALNPGHFGTVGAVGINPLITEEKCAEIQAKTVKVDLVNVGLPCTLLRQKGNDLSGLGRLAAGFDMFLSLHFNAALKKELYSAFLVGKSPRKSSISFGKLLMKNIAEKMGYRIYNDDGIMRRDNVAVLNSANLTNCPIVGLIESEFIDDEIDPVAFEQRVIVEAHIISQTIISYFRVE